MSMLFPLKALLLVIPNGDMHSVVRTHCAGLFYGLYLM